MLPKITIPCLNVVAKQTRCFKSEGVEYVSKHIPKCKTVRCMHTCNKALELMASQQSFTRQQLKCLELMVVETCNFAAGIL